LNICELQWDDSNIEHIARHGTSPKEVEDVCFGSHISGKEGKARYILGGRTENGRYLTVVIERVGKGIFRPITAFEMSERDKASYRRRSKDR